MSDPVSDLTFEQAVERLESIVAAMESGSLTLDECMSQFEQAVSLSRLCASKLDKAEKQISVLEAEDYRRPAVDIPRVREPEAAYRVNTGYDDDPFVER